MWMSMMLSIFLASFLVAWLYSRYKHWKWKKNLNLEWNDFDSYVLYMEECLDMREKVFVSFDKVLKTKDKISQYTELTEYIYPTYRTFMDKTVDFIPMTPKIKELYDMSIDFAVLELKAFVSLALSLEVADKDLHLKRIDDGLKLLEQARPCYVRWKNTLGIVRDEIVRSGRLVSYKPLFNLKSYKRSAVKNVNSFIIELKDIIKGNNEFDSVYYNFLSDCSEMTVEERSALLHTSVMPLLHVQSEKIKNLTLTEFDSKHIVLPLQSYLKIRESICNILTIPTDDFRQTLWDVDIQIYLSRKYEREWLMAFSKLGHDIKYTYK